MKRREDRCRVGYRNRLARSECAVTLSRVLRRSLIAERAIAVVSQQQVAVDQRSRCRDRHRDRNRQKRGVKRLQVRDFCRGSYVRKTSVAVVVIKRAGSTTKDKQIGTAVVVVVAGDSAVPSAFAGFESAPDCAVTSTTFLHRCARDVDASQPLQVDRDRHRDRNRTATLHRLVERLEQPPPITWRQRSFGHISERNFRRAVVDQLRFGAGRRDRFGVTALFEIVCPNEVPVPRSRNS